MTIAKVNGADVQLEHGHIRVANRLWEAILEAHFDGAQLKLVLALIRLTYGWRRKSVVITFADLAKVAGLTVDPDNRKQRAGSGGFRRALAELIEHGVIVQIEKPASGKPGAYGVQKDYSQWGRYSVAPARLAAIWDRRPAHMDEVFEDAAQDPAAGAAAPTEAARSNSGDPTGAAVVTLQGQQWCPQRGSIRGSNKRNGKNLQARKDRKDRKDRTTDTSLRDARTRFDDFWSVYPRRAGTNPKNSAKREWEKRLAQGVAPEVMIAGAVRYAAQQEALGNVGTEFVMQAVRFLGKDRHFEDDHALPAEPAAKRNGQHRTAQECRRLWLEHGFTRNTSLDELRAMAQRLAEQGTIRNADRFFAITVAVRPWTWLHQERLGQERQSVERIAAAIGGMPPPEPVPKADLPADSPTET